MNSEPLKRAPIARLTFSTRNRLKAIVLPGRICGQMLKDVDDTLTASQQRDQNTGPEKTVVVDCGTGVRKMDCNQPCPSISDIATS